MTECSGKSDLATMMRSYSFSLLVAGVTLLRTVSPKTPCICRATRVPTLRIEGEIAVTLLAPLDSSRYPNSSTTGLTMLLASSRASTARLRARIMETHQVWKASESRG